MTELEQQLAKALARHEAPAGFMIGCSRRFRDESTGAVVAKDGPQIVGLRVAVGAGDGGPGDCDERRLLPTP